MTLAAQLKELSDNITNLILDSNDADMINDLEAQLKKVLAQRSKLTQASINDSTQKYKEASAGVEEANNEVKTALGDLAKTAKVINTIATAVQLVAKVV